MHWDNSYLIQVLQIDMNLDSIMITVNNTFERMNMILSQQCCHNFCFEGCGAESGFSLGYLKFALYIQMGQSIFKSFGIFRIMVQSDPMLPGVN